MKFGKMLLNCGEFGENFGKIWLNWGKFGESFVNFGKI
jgi:hypothetical protein